MWIRSQDKTILKNVNQIQINNSNNSKDLWNYDGLSQTKLGTYATPERALEILDEIQKSIFDLENSKSYNIVSNTQDTIFPVYEMPQE